MAIDLKNCLVVGISSRALFDLTESDRIFQSEGLKAYEDHQILMENKALDPGVGFPLVKVLLNLKGQRPEKRKIEVVVMSKNSAETSLRIFHSIQAHNLDITRAALTGGVSLAPYIDAFSVDLFLSFDSFDVQAVVNKGTAAALLYDKPKNPVEDVIDQIRVAFDGDAVLFSDESEKIFQENGLEAFIEHEKQNARKPLPEGPFAKLAKSFSFLQSQYDEDHCPIRTALVTARNSPTHERVIRTLRTWGVDINESFFLGGMPKVEILKAFRPHIFFDDQKKHCDLASDSIATGHVPYVQRAEEDSGNLK
jgi:5'-nucleotidase